MKPPLFSTLPLLPPRLFCLLLPLLFPVWLFSQPLPLPLAEPPLPPPPLTAVDLSDNTAFNRLPPAFRSQAAAFFAFDNPPTGMLRTEPLSLSPAQWARLPLVLMQFSRLTDVRYYSVSRNRERPLFKEIYALSPPQEAAPLPASLPLSRAEAFRIPDPVPDLSSFPVDMTCLFFQDDTSFGKSLWRCRLQSTPSGWRMSYENLSPIRKGWIECVPENRLKMLFILQPTGLYSLIGADISPLTLFKNRIQVSLNNRIAALSQYFLNALNR